VKNCAWALLATALVVGCHLVRRDTEPPLLLEEPGDAKEASPKPKGPVADNTRCYVCHMNYEDEELAVGHARANVGCEACHGPSDAHCNDENNITPPDKMFPKHKISPSCMSCHPKSKLAKKDAHKLVLAGTATKKKLCTDCHGEHRLERRTVRWDKTTGKLLPEKNTPK
jgi:hypothetical protein